MYVLWVFPVCLLHWLLLYHSTKKHGFSKNMVCVTRTLNHDFTRCCHDIKANYNTYLPNLTCFINSKGFSGLPLNLSPQTYLALRFPVHLYKNCESEKKHRCNVFFTQAKLVPPKETPSEGHSLGESTQAIGNFGEFDVQELGQISWEPGKHGSTDHDDGSLKPTTLRVLPYIVDAWTEDMTYI